MGGFGDFLGDVALGAASGFGNYLVGKGERDQKLADEERMTQRQMALERYRAGLQEASADRALVRDKEKISHTAVENRVSNRLELNQRATIDAAEDTRKTAAEIAKEKREFETWKAKHGIEQNSEKALIAYRTEKEIEAAAKKDGLKAMGDGDIDAETGTRVLMFTDKDGNVRTYDTGLVVQQPVTDELGIRSTPAPTRKATRGWREGDGGGSAPAQTSGGKKVLSASAYQAAVAKAQEAVRDGKPGWKGLNAAGIRKKLQDAYGAQGYELPSVR